ncbi:transcription factor bHLH162-like isoform X2 [Solanum pennellii]|uniref:Transcription factor bHLH162-like isoform X2 n=1 Tax=Solanum pennellii TaxID=28526 RepID=A0ABM1V001_SOLPN|nr:transcription factor bHLH162-like isoform X2 [Solanum pennellii]
MYSSYSASRLEKKYVEKHRRNNMKILFNHLYSLLPPHPSQEAMGLPGQIDASITCIKNLEIKLEKSKMQLEKLRTKKRSNLLSPQIEVQEMSPTMDLILITGLDKLSMFYNIIRLLNEEGFEVIDSSFSLHGNSKMQIFHETKVIGNSTMVYRKVKELLNGSSSSDDIIETLLNSWDNQIYSEMLELINLT